MIKETIFTLNNWILILSTVLLAIIFIIGYAAIIVWILGIILDIDFKFSYVLAFIVLKIYFRLT